MTQPRPSRTTRTTTDPSNGRGGGGGNGGGGSRRGLTLPPLPPLPHSSFFLENTTNVRHIIGDPNNNNNEIIYAMSILDAALAIVDEQEPGMSY